MTARRAFRPDRRRPLSPERCSPPLAPAWLHHRGSRTERPPTAAAAGSICRGLRPVGPPLTPLGLPPRECSQLPPAGLACVAGGGTGSAQAPRSPAALPAGCRPGPSSTRSWICRVPGPDHRRAGVTIEPSAAQQRPLPAQGTLEPYWGRAGDLLGATEGDRVSVARSSAMPLSSTGCRVLCSRIRSGFHSPGI